MIACQSSLACCNHDKHLASLTSLHATPCSEGAGPLACPHAWGSKQWFTILAPAVAVAHGVEAWGQGEEVVDVAQQDHVSVQVHQPAGWQARCGTISKPIVDRCSTGAALLLASGHAGPAEGKDQHSRGSNSCTGVVRIAQVSHVSSRTAAWQAGLPVILRHLPHAQLVPVAWRSTHSDTQPIRRWGM